MSRPKAVLWDMDGTLIDTEPLWGKATFELGELLGRPLTPEVRARTIGGSFPNTLSVVAEWAGYELKDGDLERYRTWMFVSRHRSGRCLEIFCFQVPQAPENRASATSRVLRGSGDCAGQDCAPFAGFQHDNRDLVPASVAVSC